MHVISPLQQQTIQEAAFTPGHPLEVGNQQILYSHLSTCHVIGLFFVPLVTEKLGGLSRDTMYSFSEQAISQRTGAINPAKHIVSPLLSGEEIPLCS